MAWLIVMTLLGLAFAGGSILFWFRALTRGEPRFCAHVQRRFGVVIARGWRGHWKVTAGRGSRARHLLIELLQIGYFMAVLLVWSVGVLTFVLLVSLVQP